MPLYDCMLLLKPHLVNEAVMDLVARVGKHVISRNGVLTEIKSFGNVQLGYGIKKLDGRFYKGKLMQMTMMATPNINKELHYLNKEDRLLRWLLVKHREMKFGEDVWFEDYDYSRNTFDTFPRERTRSGWSVEVRPYDGILNKDEDDSDDDEYDVDEEEKK